MANSYSVSAADLRQRCNRISSTIYSDAALVTISEQVEADAHKRLGKSSAYDSVSEAQQFAIMKQILKEGTAAEVLSSLDMYREDGKQALINYYSKIKSLKTTKMNIVTGGPNITDELDPVNYIPEATENV